MECQLAFREDIILFDTSGLEDNVILEEEKHTT